MAGREAGAVGKDRKERSMRKEVSDEKKDKIVIEKEKGIKKVTFRDKEEVMRKDLEEIREEIRKEIKKELDSIKEEWIKTMDRLEGRIGRIENRLAEIEEGLADMRKEDSEREVVSRDEGSSGERSVGGSSTGTGKARFRSESRGGSIWSEANEGLSEKEIESVRKWVRKKEREERVNNIVIKGLRRGRIVDKEGVKEFLKEKLGIDTVVIGCRVSGNVVIAKIENGEMKREVCNKNKLKGEKLFIENDLTWEKRKIQERIYKWVRKKKGKR